MQGLLDFLSTPAGQGLLTGAASYAANAGRGAPVNSIGRGLLGGLAGYQGATDRQVEQAQLAKRNELFDLQLTQTRDGIAREQQIRDAAKRAYTPAMPAMGGLNASLPPEAQTPVMPGRQAGLNMPQFLGDVMSIDPIKGMEWQAKFKTEAPKVKSTEVGRDPKTGALVNFVLYEDGRTETLPYGVKPNHQMVNLGGAQRVVDMNSAQDGQQFQNTGDPFKDLLVRGADGSMLPNSPLINAKQGIAKAGAPQVNVTADKSYFSHVAEGMAKNDVAAIEAARSAPERVETSRRVKELLKQSPITGTGAEARLELNKALATAGIIDGKNVADTEVLASTLAAQALDAIKTSGLGGGNGFSNADRDFLERARAGKIDMTSEALSRIADLNERAATLSIKRGNSVIGKLRSSPKSGEMGQNLDPIPEPAPVKEMPKGQAFATMPAANTSNKGLFLTDQETGRRYQSNGMQWVEVPKQ